MEPQDLEMPDFKEYTPEVGALIRREGGGRGEMTVNHHQERIKR